MSYNVEDIGPTKKKVSVEVPAEEIAAQVDQAVNTYRKQARLKGFRPGKAPKAMVRRFYGPQIEQDVTQKVINDQLPPILEEYADTIISQPVLEDSDFADGRPFRFTVTFEVKPLFELGEYKGLALTREIFNISDEDVDKKVDEIRLANASIKSIEEDRPVTEGDMAVVDYKAFVGGEPLEGGSNPNYQLEVGMGRFHDDFEMALVGMNKGDEKEVEVTFDKEHYNPKLAGNTVNFQVKLLDIKERVLAELDDEFAKDLGHEEIDSLDTLKSRIRQELEEAEESRVQRLVEDQAQEKLRENTPLDPPDSLVGQEADALLANTKMNLQRSGINLEAMGMSEDKLRENYRPEAEKRVRNALILEKIAKAETIEATDEDVDGRIMEVAARTGQPPDVIREIYIKNNMMESMRESIVAEKTLQFVIDNATIENVEPSPEDGSPADE